MSIGQGVDRAGRTMDRATLRLSATLLLAGQLLYILVTLFHAGGDANNHPAIFVSYARSGDWKAVHVGQFLAIAVIVAGLVLLYYAVGLRAGAAAAAARVGVVLAGVALGAVRGPSSGRWCRQQSGRCCVGERPCGRQARALRER
jgi:hypothetical protein